MSDTTHTPVEHLPHYAQLVTRLPHTEDELRTKIGEAIGEASTCWDHLEGAGVFESSRAAKVADQLIADVLRLTSLGEPSLGCASNAELLRELTTRATLGFGIDPDYTAVSA